MSKRSELLFVAGGSTDPSLEALRGSNQPNRPFSADKIIEQPLKLHFPMEYWPDFGIMNPPVAYLFWARSLWMRTMRLQWNPPHYPYGTTSFSARPVVDAEPNS